MIFLVFGVFNIFFNEFTYSFRIISKAAKVTTKKYGVYYWTPKMA